MIRLSNNESWTNCVVDMMHKKIQKCIERKGACNIALTGGLSAKTLYDAWATHPTFNDLRNVYFYFGDERCVPFDHQESNLSLVMQTLFKEGVPKSCRIIPMKADFSDSAAYDYESKLPDFFDIILLSVGGDGHIASLFPGAISLQERIRRIIPVHGPKTPYQRLTITPLVLARAENIIVLAIGENKKSLFQKAKIDPENINDLPARLVLDATWIFEGLP